jgi:hypothetical protein
MDRGDVLLCYLTGVMRWVAALEVGDVSTDTTHIWGDRLHLDRLTLEKDLTSPKGNEETGDYLLIR